MTHTDPALLAALLALVEPGREVTRSRRCGGRRSRPAACRRADRHGARVSATVAALLQAEGFSLQGNAKTLEGAQHPDRDAQFRYVNALARDTWPPATR